MELHSSGTGAGAGAWTGATRAEVAAASSAASTVGAAAVLRPADLIDSDTAKASTPKGKPPTAGVIPSHDHCSHTRITVTVEEEEEEVEGRKMRKVEGMMGHGKSRAETMPLVNTISGNQHFIYFNNRTFSYIIWTAKASSQLHSLCQISAVSTHNRD